MLLMSGIKAMHTWVRTGRGRIFGPIISMSPSNLSESTARHVLLVARRIQLVTQQETHNVV